MTILLQAIYTYKVFEKIFKKASKTYFYSSLLFPKDTRDKVSRLYAFVRRADDYVDNMPQRADLFEAFYETWKNLKSGGNSVLLPENDSQDLEIILSFIELEKSENFDHNWTIAFFDSMRMDTNKNQKYELEVDTKQYIYGSAGIIGLFMCQIMKIGPRHWQSAIDLGFAFQYINFIRDIAEDNTLSRCYFPRFDLDMHNLTNLSRESCLNNPVDFKKFINSQIEIYRSYLKKASPGIDSLPLKFKIAIKSATRLYNWSGGKIAKNPNIVFTKKMKPGMFTIFITFVIVLFAETAKSILKFKKKI